MSKKQDLISQAKYAELHKVSRKTVTVWKDAGHLSMVGGKVDAVASDRKLKAAGLGRFKVTDSKPKVTPRVTKKPAAKPAAKKPSKVTNPKPRPVRKIPPALPADDDEWGEGDDLENAPLPADPSKWTKAQASRAKEIELALVRQLERQKLEESLVDRVEMERTQFELARQIRDAWLGWPAQVYSQMAVELGVDPAALSAILEKYVRNHLLAIADGIERDADVGGGAEA